MTPRVTLVELLEVVNECAATAEEATAAAVHMVNAGLVEVIGIRRHPSAATTVRLCDVA